MTKYSDYRNKNDFKSMLKPPSRSKVISPRLQESPPRVTSAASPNKNIRGKSGIGSGIRNLQNVQE